MNSTDARLDKLEAAIAAILETQGELARKLSTEHVGVPEQTALLKNTVDTLTTRVQEIDQRSKHAEQGACNNTNKLAELAGRLDKSVVLTEAVVAGEDVEARFDKMESAIQKQVRLTSDLIKDKARWLESTTTNAKHILELKDAITAPLAARDAAISDLRSELDRITELEANFKAFCNRTASDRQDAGNYFNDAVAMITKQDEAIADINKRVASTAGYRQRLSNRINKVQEDINRRFAAVATGKADAAVIDKFNNHIDQLYDRWETTDALAGSNQESIKNLITQAGTVSVSMQAAQEQREQISKRVGLVQASVDELLATVGSPGIEFDVKGGIVYDDMAGGTVLERLQNIEAVTAALRFSVAANRRVTDKKLRAIKARVKMAREMADDAYDWVQKIAPKVNTLEICCYGVDVHPIPHPGGHASEVTPKARNGVCLYNELRAVSRAVFEAHELADEAKQRLNAVENTVDEHEQLIDADGELLAGIQHQADAMQTWIERPLIRRILPVFRKRDRLLQDIAEASKKV